MTHVIFRFFCEDSFVFFLTSSTSDSVFSSSSCCHFAEALVRYRFRLALGDAITGKWGSSAVCCSEAGLDEGGGDEDGDEEDFGLTGG